MAKTIKTPLIQDIPKNPFGLNPAAFSTPIGAAPTTGWGNPDDLGSVALVNTPRQFNDALVTTSFERTLSANELQYQLAEQQGILDNILGFTTNFVTSATAELLKTPGYLWGVTTGDYNNSWVDGISKVKENLNPTYLSRDAVEGSLGDKLLSGSYWASTVADTFGFAASFMVPGAALKALNLGGKLSKAAAVSAKAVGAEKAANIYKALNKTAAINNPIARFALGKEISVAGTINSAASTAAMAFLESAAEGFNTYDEVRNALEQDRASGLNAYSDEEIDAMANTAGSKVQSGNMPILLLSNMIWGRMLFDKVGNISSSKKSILQAVKNPEAREALQQSVLKGLNPFKIPAHVIGKTADGWLATNLVKGFITEGFLEEYQQTGLQRAVVEEALSGKQDKNRIDLIDAFNRSSQFWEYLNKFAGTSWNWDDQQVESTVLGGLVGFGMQAPATRSQIAAHNSYLFGNAAYTPSKVARVFGAKSRPEATGLFSVVDNLRQLNPVNIKPEQYKEFFRDENGTKVFDWPKVNRYLADSSNEAMHAAARMATLLERRKNLVDNAPDDLSKEILAQVFAGEDIIANFGELMTNEYGADIFNSIVDEMIENQSKSIEELTGVAVSDAQKKSQVAELKQLAKLTNEAALEVIRENNSFDDLSGYNPVGYQKHGSKLTKQLYRKGLLQARLHQAVKTTIMERSLKNVEETLGTLKTTLESQNLDLDVLLQQNKAYDDAVKELKQKEKEAENYKYKEKQLNKKRIANQRLEEPLRKTEEGLLNDFEEEKKNIAQEIETLKATIETLKDDELNTKIEAAQKNKKNLDFTVKFLENKYNSIDAVLNKGYIAEERTEDNNIVFAHDGSPFKGLKDFNNKLWNLDYIKKDYENFVKLEEARAKEAAKQEKLNKIKDNSLAQIFNNATEPEFIEYSVPKKGPDEKEITDDNGKLIFEKKQATFFFSAGFTLKVLNSERSGFTNILDDAFYDGKMRIVEHKPASESSLEYLMFKSDYSGDNVSVTFKLYSDGTLELIYGYTHPITVKYNKNEYTLSSEGIQDIDTTRQLEDYEIAAIKNSIEAHKESFDAKTLDDVIDTYNKIYNNEVLVKTFGDRNNPDFFAQPVTILKEIDNIIKDILGQKPDLEGNRFKKAYLDAKKQFDAEHLLRTFQELKDEEIRKAAEMQEFLENLTSLTSEQKKQKLDDFKKALMDATIQLNESKEEQKKLLNELDNFKDNLRSENYPLFELLSNFGLNVLYKKDIKAISALLDILEDEHKRNPETFSKYLDENKNSDFVKELLSFQDNQNLEELLNFINDEKDILSNIINLVYASKPDISGSLREIAQRINDNIEAINSLKEDNKTLKEIDKAFGSVSDLRKRRFAVIHDSLITTSLGLHENDSPYTDLSSVNWADSNMVTLEENIDLIRSAGNEFQPESSDSSAFNSITREVLRDYYQAKKDAALPEDKAQYDEFLADDFVFDYKYFNREIFKIKDIEEWAESIKNDAAKAEQYQRAKAMIADFYYYAFTRIGTPHLQDVAAVFVTVHNVNKLPEQIRNDIYFYVPALQGKYNIDYITSLGIPLNEITDIKSVIVNKKAFEQNPSDIDSYTLSPTFNNHVIASSIRDFSDSDAETIKKSYTVESGLTGVTPEAHESKKLEKIIEAQRNHVRFREGLLLSINKGELSVVREISRVSPGNTRAGILSETEVEKALYGELTADKISFGGFYKNAEGKSVASKESRKTGYFYLKTMNSEVLIRPRTLGQTNEVEKFFDLFLFASDPKNSAVERRAVIQYLTKALWLNSRDSKKSPFNAHFRVGISTAGDLLNKISFAGFENIDAKDLHTNMKLQASFRRKLRDYNHNFNSKYLIKNKDPEKDKSEIPFDEYVVENGVLKQIKHNNYREYLFKNKNGNKGFVKFTEIKGLDKNAGLEKTVFMSPRTNTYLNFGERLKPTPKAKTESTTEEQEVSSVLTPDRVIELSKKVSRALTPEQEAQIPEILKEFIVEEFAFPGVTFIGRLHKNDEGFLVFSNDFRPLVSADSNTKKTAQENNIRRNQFFVYKNKAAKISSVRQDMINDELGTLITLKYADLINGVLSHREETIPLDDFNKQLNENVPQELINEYNSVKELPFKKGDTVKIIETGESAVIDDIVNNKIYINGNDYSPEQLEKFETASAEPIQETPQGTVTKKTASDVKKELEDFNITYTNKAGTVLTITVINNKLTFAEKPTIEEDSVLTKINANEVVYTPKEVEQPKQESTAIDFSEFIDQIKALKTYTGLDVEVIEKLITDYINGDITEIPNDDGGFIKEVAEEIQQTLNGGPRPAKQC